MLTIAERVAKGVEYMDTFAPANWRSRINLDDLTISSSVYCIWGQVFDDGSGWSGFTTHSNEFHTNVNSYNDSPSDYGFDGPWAEIEELDAEWLRVLSV